MPREVEASLNEKQFFAKALEENLRLDGRAFDQYRALKLEFGEEYGVADVRLGNTRILTRISAQITTPYPERPFEGIFTITTELSPMTSPHFEVARSSETEILLSRLLEKTLRRSSALDTESLCLLAGQYVWAVRADVHVLSHDGNLVDAACIAVVAALSHFRKNDIEVHGENLTVFTLAERDPIPLSLLHLPLCVTFSFYKSWTQVRQDQEAENQVLLDTTLLEEQLRDGACTISMNRHGEVCQIAKLGGAPVDAVQLLQCASMADVRVKELSAYVKRSLEEDARRRDTGGLISELSAENDR